MAISKRTPKEPVQYSEDLALKICERIARGETVTAIGKEKGMPTAATIFDWAFKDKNGFTRLYNEARALFWERLQDEMVDISDDRSNDYKEVERRGRMIIVPDHDHINRARLRVDTRKFILAKRKPKEWGDHVGEETATTQKLADTVLEIISRVAHLGREPVQAHVIEISPAELPDKESDEG